MDNVGALVFLVGAAALFVGFAILVKYTIKILKAG